jgi:NADH dehydrogenase FAD-containing subunit
VRRILVIGGGIAGVESALTLARGLEGDRVTLLTHSEVLRVMPDLVYVPTGVAAHRIEVPLRELLAAGRSTW